jgi:hypothetical protein
MRARPITFALAVALLACFATHTVAVLSQKDRPVVSWYLPRKERSKLYDKVEVWGGPLRSQVLCHWITPAMARALVSFNIDQEKLSSEVAEARYQELRPRDYHLVLITMYGKPIGRPGLRMRVRLATTRDKVGIEGSVLESPFPTPFVNSIGPAEPVYLLAFPRLDARGEKVITDLEEEVRVVIEYPGQAIHLRAKAKRFASALEDL